MSPGRREREEMGKVVEGKEEEVEGLRIEGRLREEEMEMGRREVVRWRERYEGLMREVKEREREEGGRDRRGDRDREDVSRSRSRSKSPSALDRSPFSLAHQLSILT